MQFNLLSPLKKQHPQKTGPFQGSFEARLQVIYTFEEHGIQVKKPIDTFYKSIPKGQYQAEIPEVLPVSNEVAATYLKFQSIITHCITNAEAVNNQLRDFLLKIRELNESKEEIMQMDFMALRGLFSDFLHGYTPIKRQPNYDTKAKRQNLTRMMHRFIIDRNIYTHGALLLQRPEEIFVIEYIEEKKAKRRCEVRLPILESFL